MKITKKKLEKLILEETRALLAEQESGTLPGGVEFVSSNRTGKYVPGLEAGLDYLSGELKSIESKVDDIIDKLDRMSEPKPPMSDPDEPPMPPMEESNNLKKIIEQEVESFIKEQFATTQALQPRSDTDRNINQSSLAQNLERLDKAGLKAKVKAAQAKNDSVSKKLLDDIEASFPLTLSDGEVVSSMEDLMGPAPGGGYSDPEGFTGIAAAPS